MIKQVIVLNMEVPFPLGRFSAMAAHASVGAVLEADHTDKEMFTKIITKTWGEDALHKLQKKAAHLGLPSKLVEDDGYVAALAIGPDHSEKIDKVTGHLVLI
jgi:peptidyl-tRNA hydrolase